MADADIIRAVRAVTDAAWGKPPPAPSAAAPAASGQRIHPTKIPRAIPDTHPVVPLMLFGAGLYLAWFGVHYFKKPAANGGILYPTAPIKAVLQGKAASSVTGTTAAVDTALLTSAFAPNPGPAPTPAATGTSTSTGTGSKTTPATGSTPSGSSGSGSTNELTVAKYLVANGYSRAAAAGIASCIAGESSGDPESVGSGGAGLIGWTPPSSASPNVNIVTGNATADLNAQMTDIIAYNNAQGSGRIAMLNAITDPVQAADFYSQNFERPLVTDSDVRSSVATSIYSQL